MLVYIGNFPGDTQLIEIQNLLGTRDMLIDYATYRAKPAGYRDHHFILAKTKNNESADDLILELNGSSFRGAELEARHFVKRKQPGSWPGAERRTNQYGLDF